MDLGSRCALVAGAVLLVARAGLADPVRNTDVKATPYRFTDAPVTVDGVLGFGTPVGVAGAVVSYDVDTALSMGAGVGTNFAGPQFAGLIRVRPCTWERPERALALQVGGAVAVGPYGGQIGAGFIGDLMGGSRGPDAQNYTLDHAFWAQADVGIEVKRRSGLHLALSTGIAAPLNPDGGSCRRADNRQPVACDFHLVPSGQRPGPIPLVLTGMMGWSF